MGIFNSQTVLISSFLATCLMMASFALMLVEMKRLVREDSILFSGKPIDPALIHWLDMEFFFDSTSAYKLLKTLGEEGRAMHMSL
jgi:hypothetical protein